MNIPDSPAKVGSHEMTGELMACLEIGKLLTATRNHKKIFEHIMRCGSKIIKAEHWSLLIKDEETGNLNFEIVVGADKTLFAPIILGPDEGIAPHVAQTGKPMFVPDVAKESLFNRKVDLKTGFVTRSIVCIPLSIRGKVMGVIEIVNIENMDFFSAKDFPILSILADYAAIAIDNSRYVAKIRKLSITDEYTGLNNARFMHDFLDDFFKTAQPEIPAIAAVFMDMDNFKTIVDTHGHLEGSDLLRRIGVTIHDCLSDRDVLIKYGGDEYVILMPGRNSKDAYLLSQKISEAFRNTTYPISERDRIGVTASFGVASCPEHASDKKHLLIAADNALFKAKNTQKNSIGMA
ncbi:sensor domain-containing diguanylate cyclase [Desulfatiferula olefinivorans]